MKDSKSALKQWPSRLNACVTVESVRLTWFNLFKECPYTPALSALLHTFLPDTLLLIHGGGETGPSVCTDLLKHTYTFLFLLQTLVPADPNTHVSLWHIYISLEVRD